MLEQALSIQATRLGSEREPTPTAIITTIIYFNYEQSEREPKPFGH